MMDTERDRMKEKLCVRKRKRLRKREKHCVCETERNRKIAKKRVRF